MKPKTAIRAKWVCPKCGAGAHEHGKGGREKCLSNHSLCDGFVCECDAEYDDPDHGATFEKPCRAANCYHCGWGGVFPPKPKGMQAWEKKALDAGWMPPDARRKELGL